MVVRANIRVIIIPKSPLPNQGFLQRVGARRYVGTPPKTPCFTNIISGNILSAAGWQGYLATLVERTYITKKNSAVSAFSAVNKHIFNKNREKLRSD
jgi:hypothetical protein